ncbi:Signal transduction histidine kinase [Micrococcales bacterium KH10]|nr:Signal transduction histidine kinase [Micrococcales bacterium KH10]
MRLRTVRSRILAAMLALAAIALVLSGGIAYGLQRSALLSDIDATLQRHASEFEMLAESGTDPLTATEFATAEELVTAAMKLTVPTNNEGMLGLREGRGPLVPGQDSALRLQDDAQLLAVLGEQMAQDEITITTITTSTARYRVMIAPVVQDQRGTATSAPRAAFVVAIDRDAHLAEFNEVARTYAIVAAIALALTAVIGWIVAGRLLHPIRTLSATARKVSEEDLSGRIAAEGDTDLADVAQTFNEMLDRLETAFTARHALLDDVSHELRTPLTVVRGHLELMDPSDQDDVETTRQVALDEVDRMDRLVTDLSTLATADSPDFIQMELVDIGTLTDDVYDKVRQWTSHQWRVTERSDTVMSADPQRLTQAWLQLCANAAKFSDPDSTIEIGSRTLDGQVTLWVKDHGRGIAPEDIPIVTERFARAGVTRQVEGAGLGLSIVDAIAQRHGGYVAIESELGAGTIVHLHLPIAGQQDVAEQYYPVAEDVL